MPTCYPYFDLKSSTLWVFCDGPNNAILRTDGAGNILLNGESIYDEPTTANTARIEVVGSDDPNTLDVSAVAGFAGPVGLYGLGGNDRLIGSAGRDWPFENDFLAGGDGDDFLDGGAGRDYLSGEAGHDTIWGGSGVDDLYGGEGNDQLFGHDGIDSLYGQAGNDSLYGGAGMDYLNGGDGNDSLYGEQGHDDLYGEAGTDQLFGGSEVDHMNAGGNVGDRVDSGDARTSGFVNYGGGVSLATTTRLLPDQLFTLLSDPSLIRTTLNNAWASARPNVTRELITAISRLRPPSPFERIYDITLNLDPEADFQVSNQNDVTSVKFMLRHNTSLAYNRLDFRLDIPILPDPHYRVWFDVDITGTVALAGPVRLENLTARLTVPRIDNLNSAASVYRALFETFTGNSLRTLIEREINGSPALRDALRDGLGALNQLLQEVFPFGDDLTTAFHVPTNMLIIRLPSFNNPTGSMGESPSMFAAAGLFGDPFLSDLDDDSPFSMPFGSRARRIRG